jgi:molecular chaperone GrpE
MSNTETNGSSNGQAGAPTEESAAAAGLEDELFLAESDEADEVVEHIADTEVQEVLVTDPEDEQQKELDALRAKVAELSAQLAATDAAARDAQDKLMRKAADYENLRRRHMKEKEELSKFAGESILKEFVPVLDDLDRALDHLQKSPNADVATLVQGVAMVQRKFVQTLERRGVTAIDCVGAQFDPQFHEAIQQVADASVPNNTIIQAFQRAYMLNERLLRPALVVVATGGPAPVAQESAEGDDQGVAEPADAAENAANSGATDET